MGPKRAAVEERGRLEVVRRRFGVEVALTSDFHAGVVNLRALDDWNWNTF